MLKLAMAIKLGLSYVCVCVCVCVCEILQWGMQFSLGQKINFIWISAKFVYLSSLHMWFYLFSQILANLIGYNIWYLMLNNLITAFPNVFIALMIYLTVPVTVASGERRVSKLKLIKIYLLSAISQEKLNNLVMLLLLSIENDIAERIIPENISRLYK